MRGDTTRRGFDSHVMQLAAPALIGISVGVVGWLVNRLVQQLVVIPLFCHSPDSFTVCSYGGSVSWIVVTLVLVALSVLVMVRFYVFRPLLIVLAVLFAVWGIGDWLAGLTLVTATLWQAVIFGFAYAVFAWLARVDNFWLAATLSVALAIICRVAISQA